MDDYGDYGESFGQELERLRRENKELSSKLGKSENDKDALSTALTNVNRQLLDAQKEIQFLKDEGDEDSEWRDQVADESEAKIKELQSRLDSIRTLVGRDGYQAKNGGNGGRQLLEQLQELLL